MDVFFIKGSLTDFIHKEMEKSNQLFQMCLYFYYISQTFSENLNTSEKKMF